MVFSRNGSRAEIRALRQEAATHLVAYLVDMAKAEALDLMGETKKSLEFVEGHLLRKVHDLN